MLKRLGQIAIIFLFGFIIIVSCKRADEAPDPMNVPQPPNPALSTASAPPPAPEPPPNPPGNLLVNPGFEDGDAGWFWMKTSQYWVPFDISSKKAHTGEKSAYLRIEAKPGAPAVEIHGVIQELKPNRLPAKAGGFYRIENWQRGASKQYLQFVVIIWGGHPQFKNYQIRYILDGISVQPHRMTNVKYIFLPGTSDDPKQNEWVSFEAKILDDFKREWGMTPTGYEKINFFFEARYDLAPEEGKTVRADVYYDDLYIGD